MRKKSPEDMKEKPLTDTNKITSEDLSKTMMLTSEENNKALEN